MTSYVWCSNAYNPYCTMKELLCVFLGGGVGSSLRYLISLTWRSCVAGQASETGVPPFPWPTLIANVLGCFLIGLFYEYSQSWGLSPQQRLLLTTGICGGFTTFSTFSYEGLTYLNQGHMTLYALYTASSILLGIAACCIPHLFHS